MPGFEGDHHGPALPIQLYQLGDVNPQRSGGPGAPLAMRLFIEAVLYAPYVERQAGQPVAFNVTLRQLLDGLYPGARQPRPTEYWPRLLKARATLDALEIPWHDPATGRGGFQRIVLMSGLPPKPIPLHDEADFIVDLPPGSGDGPFVPQSLSEWGAKSSVAYTTLLNLSYEWWNPGVTRMRTPSGMWVQVQDPQRYRELSDADVVAITRPLSSRQRGRELVTEGWETLHKLEKAGELRIVGRRVLPPPPPKQPTDPAQCR